MDSKICIFWTFCISNEIPICSSRIQFLFLQVVNSNFIWISQIRICRKLGFQLLNNLNGILEIVLIGTLFNIYAIVFNASLHKNLSSLDILKILRTIYINIQLLLSVTPF